MILSKLGSAAVLSSELSASIHFAADALEARGHRQRHDIIGCLVRPVFPHRQINRLPSKQLSKMTSGEIDVDAIGVDVDAASQRQPAPRQTPDRSP